MCCAWNRPRRLGPDYGDGGDIYKAVKEATSLAMEVADVRAAKGGKVMTWRSSQREAHEAKPLAIEVTRARAAEGTKV